LKARSRPLIPTGVAGGKPRLVLLYVDGKRVDHDTRAPFVFTWNSARVPNGRHILELRVTASHGRTASTKLTVTVANPAIASQAVTDGIWGVVTKGHVDRVEFAIDGQPAGSVAAAPFQLQLPQLAPGEHSLTARAIGPNGTVAEATIHFTV